MTDSQSFGKRRKSPEGKRARKRDLLEAARALFVEQGYERTSISAIVKRAGVAQGTFYLYFDKKQQVLVSLRGHVLAEYVRAFERVLARPSPPDTRLVDGVRALARVTKKNRELLGVIRQATTGEETEQVWLEGRATLAAPLAALIEEGQGAGVFGVDDPRLAAHLALALFDDLLYESLVYKRPAGPRIIERAGLRFLLRGLGVAPDRIDALVSGR